MKLVRRFLPWILLGGVVCLSGFAFWFLSRKQFFQSSSDSSEAIPQALRELNLWKASTEQHLETLFDRVKSVAGRIDRAKRKQSEGATDDGTPPEEGGAPATDEQGRLNRLVAQRLGMTG
jgi:hypothetical protein